MIQVATVWMWSAAFITLTLAFKHSSCSFPSSRKTFSRRNNLRNRACSSGLAASHSLVNNIVSKENSWQLPLNFFTNNTLKLFLSRYVNKLEDKSGPRTCYLECSHVRNMVWKIYVDYCFESLESSFTLFKHKQCKLAKRKRNIGGIWNISKTEKKLQK